MIRISRQFHSLARLLLGSGPAFVQFPKIRNASLLCQVKDMRHGLSRHSRFIGFSHNSLLARSEGVDARSAGEHVIKRASGIIPKLDPIHGGCLDLIHDLCLIITVSPSFLIFTQDKGIHYHPREQSSQLDVGDVMACFTLVLHQELTG